ncbi:colicin immunity domain-containing protein [Streptomyces sp. NPDC059525]|uniref:colicin immunity domain-containing protein n=1 Tax=Streptomyces sp. NPDC059525 TaxID=3346857 RepID=UPI003681F774
MNAGQDNRSHEADRARQRMWKTAGAVPPDSATGRQLALMSDLSHATISPQDFAKAWLDSRRAALRNGERIGEHLSRHLDEVFYTLDDYPIDPTLREPGDATDDELLAAVNDALEKIEHARD